MPLKYSFVDSVKDFVLAFAATAAISGCGAQGVQKATNQPIQKIEFSDSNGHVYLQRGNGRTIYATVDYAEKTKSNFRLVSANSADGNRFYDTAEVTEVNFAPDMMTCSHEFKLEDNDPETLLKKMALSAVKPFPIPRVRSYFLDADSPKQEKILTKISKKANKIRDSLLHDNGFSE